MARAAAEEAGTYLPVHLARSHARHRKKRGSVQQFYSRIGLLLVQHFADAVIGVILAVNAAAVNLPRPGQRITHDWVMVRTFEPAPFPVSRCIETSRDEITFEEVWVLRT